MVQNTFLGSSTGYLMKAIISLTDFSTVFPIWKNKLWPERIEPIHSHSTILFKGGTNEQSFLAEVFFVKMEFSGKIIGVCSAQKTKDQEFRSRGLWVSKDFRRQGYGSQLFRFVEQEAKKRDCCHLWTLARHTAKNFYLAMNMKECGPTNNYEYGPHFWMSKMIRV